jgi:hypothetical protein
LPRNRWIFSERAKWFSRKSPEIEIAVQPGYRFFSGRRRTRSQ